MSRGIEIGIEDRRIGGDPLDRNFLERNPREPTGKRRLRYAALDPPQRAVNAGSTGARNCQRDTPRHTC
eukprot:7167805-Alexandrium_andersonii.AAC.1